MSYQDVEINIEKAHMTYVCFLPLQQSQYVPINEVIDDVVKQYYEEKWDALDVRRSGMRIIGIEAGNPKRYNMEDIYVLHETIEGLLELPNVTFNLSLFEKYFSAEGMAALDLTINSPKVQEEQCAYEDFKAQAYEFSPRQCYELLPLSYPFQTSIKVFEYRPDYYDKVIVMPASALHLMQDDHAIYIVYEANEDYHPRTWLSRAGISVQYTSLDDAVMFDLLHYGFQYQLDVIFIKSSPYFQRHSGRITTYGTRLCSLDPKYRVQSPHFDLFTSKEARQMIAAGRFELKDISMLRNFYDKPFTIIDAALNIPLYYKRAAISELLSKPHEQVRD